MLREQNAFKEARQKLLINIAEEIKAEEENHQWFINNQQEMMNRPNDQEEAKDNNLLVSDPQQHYFDQIPVRQPKYFTFQNIEEFCNQEQFKKPSLEVHRIIHQDDIDVEDSCNQRQIEQSQEAGLRQTSDKDSIAIQEECKLYRSVSVVHLTKKLLHRENSFIIRKIVKSESDRNLVI